VKHKLIMLISILVIFTLFINLVLSLSIYEVNAAPTNIKVTNSSLNNPGYIWCQKSDGNWSTYSSNDGNVTALNVGVEPAETKVYTSASIQIPTTVWSDGNGNTYSASKVINAKPITAQAQGGNTTDRTAGVDLSTNTVFINGISGKGWPYLAGGNACGGNNSINYYFPITVAWEGEIVPSQATIHINYFTDTGANLSGVFPAETRTMEQDSIQSFAHKTNADYTYLGYKKSSVAQPSGGAILTGDPPSFTYDGTYSIYWVSYYYKAKAGVPIPDPEPEPEPETPANIPPEAEIESEYKIRAGDELLVDGSHSYDPDGYIVNYYWTTEGANGAISGSKGLIWYPNFGTKRIELVVEDNGGATDSTSKAVDVTAPFISAKIFVSGTLKQNRKVTLTNLSDTPTHYPISNALWTIEGENGASNGDIRHTGNLTDIQTLDTLFKKPGKYRVTLSVTNSAGYSDTTTTTLDIVPDLPPIAEFSVPTWIYRDKLNSNYALMEIKNMSSSPDNDPIDEHSLSITFNKDNNYFANSIVVDKDDPKPGLKAKTLFANFTDDSILKINIESLNVNQIYSYSLSGITITAFKKPDGTIQLKSKNVGRYLIDMKITESFGQPTIPEFLTATDYQTSNTVNKPKLEKIVTIDNRAPTVNFKP
jgi:hypothetical protein